MANRYWINGGSGDWDDTANWSSTSGGAGGASVPTSADNVFFDANSNFFPSDFLVILNVASCNNFDASACAETVTVYGYDNLKVYGNLTLSSTFSIESTVSGGYYQMTVQMYGTADLTLNDSIIFAPVYAYGDVTLQSSGTISLVYAPTGGTLNTNNYDLITGRFLVYTGGMTTLGTSTITTRRLVSSAGDTSSSEFYASPSNLSSSSATIVIEGTSGSFKGGGGTYSTVTLSANTTTVTGDNTIGTLNLTAGITANFASSSNNTITSFAILSSSASNTTLQSSSSGTRFTLTKTSGSVSESKLSIQDSAATGGASWVAGSGSQDLGNNTGWVFTVLAPTGSSSITFSQSTPTYILGKIAPLASAAITLSGISQSSTSRIETNASRKVVQSTQVAWKKSFDNTYVLFTIGVSSIGGGDYIASDGSINSDWNKYNYIDESQYVTELNWEQEFNMPLGGLVKVIGDLQFDNTSGRFLPDFMGGDSELFTVVAQPRKPLIINAGYFYEGVDQLNPQFVGLTTKAPVVDQRSKTASMHFSDFMDFIQNKYVDETAMYTGVRSDVLIETILTDLGFATSQFNLDTGINIIPFAYLPAGSKLGDVLNSIVQAENGHIYQDVSGVIRFENRQHWNTEPYTYVQRVITTAMVIDSSSPTDDHIINVVEVNSTPYTKQASAQIYDSPIALEINNSGITEVFINFANPVLEASDPVFTANSQSDGTGTNLTSSITLESSYVFAQSAKYRFSNSSGTTAYITSLTVTGREASPTTTPIYYRTQDDSSVTAYEERPITIDNNYIQSLDWAKSFSSLILNDYSDPENLQTLTIRAISGLKISDLISWQGRNWRIYGIRTTMNPAVGYVQELSLLKRDIASYFRIGVSLIGSNDSIAP